MSGTSPGVVTVPPTVAEAGEPVMLSAVPASNVQVTTSPLTVVVKVTAILPVVAGSVIEVGTVVTAAPFWVQLTVCALVVVPVTVYGKLAEVTPTAIVGADRAMVGVGIVPKVTAWVQVVPPLVHRSFEVASGVRVQVTTAPVDAPV
jgi:hypothetical protein